MLIHKRSRIFIILICLALLNTFTSVAEITRNNFFNENQFLYKFSSEIVAEESWVPHPTSLAINTKGNILVADNFDSRIKEFDINGKLKMSFGTYGSENGQFQMPTDIAVDVLGNIYVADHNNVQKFDSKGNFIFKIGGLYSNIFSQISSMTVSQDGTILVSEFFNNRIQLFDKNGIFVRQIDLQIDNVFQTDLAIDEFNNIYVLYYTLDRLQKYDTSGNLLFDINVSGKKIDIDINEIIYIENESNIIVLDADGNFIRMFGESGTEVGQFLQIGDLAVDDTGIIYIADYGNQKILKFNSNGEFISSFGEWIDGAFNSPSDVEIDNIGNIYISDSTGSRILRFDHKQKFLDAFDTYRRYDGSFRRTSAMTLDVYGNLYALDMSNSCISKLSPDGDLISRFGESEFGFGQNVWLGDIIVDDQGYIYGVDFGGNKVIKYNPDASYMLEFESLYNLLPEYNSIWYLSDLTIDSHGDIYVLSINNVYKLNSAGVILDSFLTSIEYGQIAVDSSGNIYVVDLFGSKFCVFNELGELLYQNSDLLTQNGDGLFASGLSVNQDGDIYISDSQNNRILIFKKHYTKVK